MTPLLHTTLFDLPRFNLSRSYLPRIGLCAALFIAGAAPSFVNAETAHEKGSAASSQPPQNVSESKRPAFRRGAEVYRRDCITCHRQDGTGRDGFNGLRIPDFTRAEAVVQMTLAKMVDTLKDGHNVKDGKDWKDSLSDQDFNDVVTYIRESYMLPAAVAGASTGRKVYARTCSVCHGDRGNASSWAKDSLSPSPFDFTSYKAKKLTRDHMIKTVTYGEKDSAMVGWNSQLSPREINAVVDFVRATFIFPNQDLGIPSSKSENGGPDEYNTSSLAGPAGKSDMTKPLPNGLHGDAAKGKVLYETNCVPCHGKNGKGDGPRAFFIIPKPENFTGNDARAELNRPHLFKHVSEGVTGTVMPAWARVLNKQQIADVSEYVFTSFISPRAEKLSSSQPRKIKKKPL